VARNLPSEDVPHRAPQGSIMSKSICCSQSTEGNSVRVKCVMSLIRQLDKDFVCNGGARREVGADTSIEWLWVRIDPGAFGTDQLNPGRKLASSSPSETVPTQPSQQVPLATIDHRTFCCKDLAFARRCLTEWTGLHKRVSKILRLLAAEMTRGFWIARCEEHVCLVPASAESSCKV
jgi:hypothetical protein